MGTAAATAVASLGLFAPRPAWADDDPPSGSGNPGVRYVIRGGSVMRRQHGCIAPTVKRRHIDYIRHGYMLAA